MEGLTASTYVYVLSDKEHTSDTIITIIDRLIASIDSGWLQADVEATLKWAFSIHFATSHTLHDVGTNNPIVKPFHNYSEGALWAVVHSLT